MTEYASYRMHPIGDGTFCLFHRGDQVFARMRGEALDGSPGEQVWWYLSVPNCGFAGCTLEQVELLEAELQVEIERQLDSDGERTIQ